MTGKDAIIEKILGDAKQKANSTLEEGARKAQEAISMAYNDAKIYKDKNMAESYDERDEIVRRLITVANLEVKKELLKAKKRVIDNAFNEAMKEIKNDKKEYLKLIKKMLRFAEDGDKVVVSESDKDVISSDFVNECAVEYKKEIVRSEVFGNFAGGVILCGETSDKNLTLESELREIRLEYEPIIAQVLFGE